MKILETDFPLRKKLGKIRRQLLRIKGADWYYRILKKGEKMQSLYLKSKAVFDPSSPAEVIQWIKEHSREYPWIYNKREINCALDHGHWFPSLKIDGKVIGFIKVGVNRVFVEDYEREISLNNGEAFVYDTFIHPEHRRKHLACYLLTELFRHLSKKGIAIVYCHIPRWNLASARLYLKMGFKRLSYVRYVRLLRYYCFFPKLEKIRSRAKKEIAYVSVGPK